MFKSTAPRPVRSSDMTFPKMDQPLVEHIDPERSHPTTKYKALPDNYPIHFLPEARSYYESGHTRPPFVFQKRSESFKIVVLPTKTGSRPKDGKAIEARIVAKVCARQGHLFSPLHH